MSNVIPMPDRLNRAEPAEPKPASSVGSAPVAPIGRAVYTVVEVAALLGLSPSTTYAMVRAGQVPARRMGGRWVIPKRRFHAWLDELPEAIDDEVPAALGMTTGGAE